MKLDKSKIKDVLLKNGLSTRKSDRLAGILASSDLLTDDIKKEPKIKTKKISEVKNEEVTSDDI